MTSNQIAYKQAQEQRRSNRAREELTKSEQAETKRHNRRTETNQSIDTAVKGVTGIAKLANDPTWYNKDSQLVKDTANIAYGSPLGTILRKGQFFKSKREAMPGIAMISYIPGIGNTGDADNLPINVAAKNIYSYVRYVNSGARNYESVDLMLYILAVDSAVSSIQYLKELYAMALTAKGENWYYGRGMLGAMCGRLEAADEVINNLAQFRAMINTASLRLNSFYVPAIMPLFKRHAWMNSNLFKDYKVNRSQVYGFKPEVYYVYDDVNGRLNPSLAPWSNLQTTGVGFFDRCSAMVNSMINALTTSEDVGIMSGDILKAYGAGNLIYFDSIPENYALNVIYSEEVLSQIGAATLIGYPPAGASVGSYDCTIYQDTKGNILQGSVTSGSAFISVNVGTDSLPTKIAEADIEYNPGIINMYKDEVTPDDTMVATRLMATVEYASNTGTINVRACGTEVCLAMTIWGRDSSGFKTYAECSSVMGIDFSNPATALNRAVIQVPTVLPKFDWAPRCRIFATNGTDVVAMFDSYDIANYAVVDETTLASMHGVAMLSEFAIPNLGVTVRNR